MALIERIEGELLDAMHERMVADAEGRKGAPSVRDMAVKAASIADDHYRGAVEALERLANPEHLPRTEEAVLLQGEVVEIAEAALDRLRGQ